MASSFSFWASRIFHSQWDFSITSQNNYSFFSISYYFGLVRTHFECKSLCVSACLTMEVPYQCLYKEEDSHIKVINQIVENQRKGPSDFCFKEQKIKFKCKSILLGTKYMQFYYISKLFFRSQKLYLIYKELFVQCCQ